MIFILMGYYNNVLKLEDDGVAFATPAFNYMRHFISIVNLTTISTTTMHRTKVLFSR